MDMDIMDHLQKCHQCQVRRTDHPAPPTLLSPLPQCTEPNQRIHADLFGPLKTSENSKKYILCITDAFTKYVELVALPDKEALTVTSAIFSKWICRYGLPLELITDQGKEFANKMSAELYELLKMKHQTTSARHPQCNAAAEVCNKTIAKYLNSFVDASTLDWELYLPPLMFSYNTSYHRSVKNSPYFLTFGIDPRLPSFPAPDLNRVFYGESPASDMHHRLHFARNLAIENNLDATAKYKQSHDERAKAEKHSFQTRQLVLLENYNFLGKNTKLAPKWSGPHTIIALKGDHNVELLTIHNKKMIVNVARIKPYFLPNTEDNIDNSTEDFTTENFETQLSPDTTIPVQTAPPPSDMQNKISPQEETTQLTANTPALPAPPRRRGRPPRAATPPPPLIQSQNKGGIEELKNHPAPATAEKKRNTRPIAPTDRLTRSQTRAQAHQTVAHENAIQKINKTEALIEKIQKQLKLLQGCECKENQKKKHKHTAECIQKYINLALTGDIYRTHDLTPHQQSANDNSEADTTFDTASTPSSADPGYGGSSPVFPFDHYFDDSPPPDSPTSTPTPRELSPIPERFEEDSEANPEGATGETDFDSPTETESPSRFQTAETSDQLDDTILELSRRLAELAQEQSQAIRNLLGPDAHENAANIIEETQQEAAALGNELRQLQRRQRQFNPTHTSSPRRSGSLDELDQFLFGPRRTRSQGPVPDLPLPPRPPEYPKRKK